MSLEKQQIDEAYRAKVLHARQMTGEEKMARGYRLFEEECATMQATIRELHPAFGEMEVLELLRWRFAVAEMIENHSRRRAPGS